MRSWRCLILALAAMVAFAAPPVLAQTAKPALSRDVPLPKSAPKRAASQSPMLASPPLPLPRPRNIGEAPESAAATPAPLPGADDAALATCLAEFAKRGGEAMPVTSEETSATGECSIPGPVAFSKVHVPEAPTVSLESTVTVRCTLALEMASWIRDDLSPIAKRHGTSVAQITGVGGHACRPRNGQPGAQISEHASGNAFDLLGIKFSDGRVIALWQDDAATKEIREEVRQSACARFRTVLGPGADSSHANHVHLDMRQRRNNFSMCQWDVR